MVELEESAVYFNIIRKSDMEEVYFLHEYFQQIIYI
jgi:hypothetical protein